MSGMMMTRIRPLAAALTIALGLGTHTSANAQWESFGSLLKGAQNLLQEVSEMPAPSDEQTDSAVASGPTQPTATVQPAQGASRASPNSEAERLSFARPFWERLGKQSGPSDEFLKAAAQYAARFSPPLRSAAHRLYLEGERNAVLNFQRLGMAALFDGDISLASQSFDQAIQRIDTVYADNPQAEAAKSVWTQEAVKDFKGEPYERSMAYYYRGLAYLATGDYENARAMFMQADYQDTVAESETFAGDFGAALYLASWASYCDGSPVLGRDFFNRAIKISPEFSQIPPETTPKLVLFESGRAPQKVAGGKHQELLKWSARDSAAAEVKICSSSDPTPPCENTPIKAADLHFQATTRGGRAVDAVLAGKAVVKDTTQSVAKGAAAVSDFASNLYSQTGSRDAAVIGAIGALVSLAGTVAERAMETAADTREWDQLPRDIWMAAAPTAPVSSVVDAAAQAPESVPASMATAPEAVAQPQPVSVRSGDAVVSAKPLAFKGGCSLHWGRDRLPESLVMSEPATELRDGVFRLRLAEFPLQRE